MPWIFTLCSCLYFLVSKWLRTLWHFFIDVSPIESAVSVAIVTVVAAMMKVVAIMIIEWWQWLLYSGSKCHAEVVTLVVVVKLEVVVAAVLVTMLVDTAFSDSDNRRYR